MRSTTLRSLKIIAIATSIIFSNLSASMVYYQDACDDWQVPQDAIQSRGLGKVQVFHNDDCGWSIVDSSGIDLSFQKDTKTVY